MKIPSRGLTVGEILEESEHKYAQWIKALDALVNRAKVLNDDAVVVWAEDYDAIKALLNEEARRR